MMSNELDRKYFRIKYMYKEYADEHNYDVSFKVEDDVMTIELLRIKERRLIHYKVIDDSVMYDDKYVLDDSYINDDEIRFIHKQGRTYGKYYTTKKEHIDYMISRAMNII